jgi:large subunit ribosomal protein L25
MAQYEKLEILERAEAGSRNAKALRREGMIPAVYYYHGEDNLNLSLDQKKFWKALRSGHHIFEVNLKGKAQYVMIKELQYHPITDDIIHVDLMRVRRDEKITITVPISPVGTAEGTKQGGVLSQTLTALEISCLPGDVPEQITLDVTSVGLHESLSVGDIEVADNIEIISVKNLKKVKLRQVSKLRVKKKMQRKR